MAAQVASQSSHLGDIRQHPSWSPYDNNGGTVVAVAGNDYCVVAGSTRLSTGFNILTRDRSMVTQIAPQVFIAAAGFEADVGTLKKVIQWRNVNYAHNHKKPLGVTAAAQLVGNTLYFKRFFPYYSFTLVAGLDSDGKGAVYSYDAVGSHERVGYACQGSGSDLIQPVLDNQLKASSPLVLPQENWMSSLALEDAVDLVKSAFVSAGERDIYTGDRVEVVIMSSEGVRKEFVDLKRD